ncbi:MAG: hypothetical protein LBT19_02350 [Candidatus Nomurabacteria bacterium]|jgi:hypothetical protein|nr:hypothetical protein [Candidatus Nomurabacteria bacterium]
MLSNMDEGMMLRFLGKVRKLLAQRKRFEKALEAGDSNAAELAVEIIKLERWFEGHHPEKDVSTNTALKVLIGEAKNALAIINAPEQDLHKTKKGRRTLIDVEVPDATTSGTSTITPEARKERLPVRRMPVPRRA